MRCILFLAAASVVFGGSKVSKDLDAVRFGSVDVIVRYKQPPSDLSHSKAGKKGAVLKQDLNLVKSSAYTIPASAVQDLAADTDVEFVSPDRTFHTHAYNGAPPDYGWITAGADVATRGFGADGTGIAVAVLDSGIDDREDLKDAAGKNRIVYKVLNSRCHCCAFSAHLHAPTATSGGRDN